MKKIKSLKQLRREKRILRQREKELVRQINTGWQQLKENFQPQNIIREQTNRCKGRSSGEKDENILASSFSFAATLLARKFLKRAEEKFERYFN